jgi:hypothetical protein
MVLKKMDVHLQKNEIGPSHIPYTKITSKWIKHLTMTLNHKTSRRTHKEKNSLTLVLAMMMMVMMTGYDTKSISNKA